MTTAHSLFDMPEQSNLYSSEVVANEFIRLAAEAGKKLTHLQVQKLVYIAHGYSFPLLGRPLLYEPVEAWPHGPVIRSLYKRLRGYGRQEIQGPIPTTSRQPELNSEAQALIRAIWEAYGHLDGMQLRELTHQPETPWSGTPLNGVIPDELIRGYYTDLVRS